MLTLSNKISKIQPSKTLAITSLAKSMIKKGEDVVNFGAGEPDFDTPVEIKRYAKRSIDEGFTKYTPAGGMLELKQAVRNKFLRDNGLKYNAENIVISCGAKHSLYNIFQVLCNPGDEVIVMKPYWVSYPEMVRLAGAKPVIVEADESKGFKCDIASLKRAITKKTKAIIINSPSNPAGIVYTKKELKAIGELAVQKKIYVISDEIYEKLTFDGAKHISIASLGKHISDITITVNGVSKAYSMTGWRIGYIGGPANVIKQISVLQSHSTSNPTSISQKAALAALKMKESKIKKMTVTFQSRRDYMMKLVDKIDEISYIRPGGAFYLFCDISKTGYKAAEFAKHMLTKKKVAVIPGEAFGTDKYIRLSFATDKKTIKKGIMRIKSWVKQ